MTSGNEMIPAPSRRALRENRSTAGASDISLTAPVPRPASKGPDQRWSRRRGVLGVFAAFAAVGFVAAYIGPTGAAIAEASADDAVSLYASSLDDVQTLELIAASAEEAKPDSLNRGNYSVYVKPKPKPTATASSSGGSTAGWTPAFVTPNPGSAKAIAYDMVKARGWGDDEYACLVALWKKESGWRVNAYNRSSGAYGIPQALPGKKMAKAGADWQTNPATQIKWGLGYIKGRYSTPCGAWSHSQRTGWY